MQIIKTVNLGLIHRTLFHQGQYQLVISPLLWFSLGNSKNVMSEQEGWKKTLAALGPGAVLDVGAPKYYPEVLMSGVARPQENTQQILAGLRLSTGFEKTVEVTGRQYWYQEKQNWRLSTIDDVTSTPLTWNNAYGGCGIEDNPTGTGYVDDALLSTGATIELPRLRPVGTRFNKLDQRIQAVNFAPLDMTLPIRIKRAGTYDEQWLHDGYPGLASDHDPAVYNTAQEDQWLSAPLAGDESYQLVGVGPSGNTLTGILPSMRARAFVQRNHTGSQDLIEVATQIDTLWFFPEQGVGLLIYRGLIPVDDSDALDIDSIMLAYERLVDTPRPLNHYCEVHQLRTDPETAVAHVMHEAQLSPLKTRAQREQEQKEKEQAIAAQKELVKQGLERVAGDIAKAADELPTEAPELPEPDIPALPVLPSEAIARGDVDLTEMIEAGRALANQCQEEGRQLTQQLEEKMQEEMLAKAIAEQPQTLSLAELSEELEQRFAPLQATDTLSVEQQQQIQQARFLGRRAAVTDSTDAARYDEEVTQHLRCKVIELIGAEAELCGLDLSGADLSGLDFSGRDLSGSLFEAANLRGCNFHKANLNSAVFVGAALDHANFTDSQLGAANFSQLTAEQVCFAGASLDRAKMIKTTFRHCDFSGSQQQSCVALESTFYDCILRGSSVSKGQWIKTDLDKLDSSGATISESMFIDVRMNNIVLSGASLTKCIFAQASVEQGDFSNTKLDHVQFTAGCGLQCSDFSHSIGRAVGLQGVDLTGATLAQATFSDSNLSEAALDNANLQGAGFQRCLFSGARLVRVNAQQANFMESLLRKSTWIDADLRHVEFYGANAKESLFENCRLRGVRNLDSFAEVRV